MQLTAELAQRTHFPLPEPPQKIASVAVTGAGDALFAGIPPQSAPRSKVFQPAMHLGLRAAQLSLTCTDPVHPDIASLCADQREIVWLMAPSLPLKYSTRSDRSH